MNDSLLRESLTLNPATALRLAVEATSALDARLHSLDPAAIARLVDDASRPETDTNRLVHRYRHRSQHLDEIEVALRRSESA